MGIPFSRDQAPDWTISFTPADQHLIRSDLATFMQGTRQNVLITGDIPVNCTLEVDNSSIVIDTSAHSAVIIGNNNEITVNSNQVRVRVEGVNNSLENNGTGTVLFITDNEVRVEGEELTSITNRTGIVHPDAPVQLELPNGQLANGLGHIRFTYISQRGGGGSGSGASSRSVPGSGGAGDASSNVDDKGGPSLPNNGGSGDNPPQNNAVDKDPSQDNDQIPPLNEPSTGTKRSQEADEDDSTAQPSEKRQRTE